MYNIEYCEKINPKIGIKWRGYWDNGFIEPNRYLYDHELVYFNTSGISQVITAKQTWRCTKGDVIIIPPGELHCSHWLKGEVERYCIHFDFISGQKNVNPPYIFLNEGAFEPELCKKTPTFIPLQFPLYKHLRNHEEFLKTLKLLFENKALTPSSIIKEKALFLELFSILLFDDELELKHTKVLGGKAKFSVLKIKGYIDIHYTENIEISDLARIFNLTSSHICRLFRQELSISPLDYIHKLRMEKACEHISTTTLNISEIAYSLGFNDPNYFTRTFKKHFGISPTKMREGGCEFTLQGLTLKSLN